MVSVVATFLKLKAFIKQLRARREQLGALGTDQIGRAKKLQHHRKRVLKISRQIQMAYVSALVGSFECLPLGSGLDNISSHIKFNTEHWKITQKVVIESTVQAFASCRHTTASSEPPSADTYKGKSGEPPSVNMYTQKFHHDNLSLTFAMSAMDMDGLPIKRSISRFNISLVCITCTTQSMALLGDLTQYVTRQSVNPNLYYLKLVEVAHLRKAPPGIYNISVDLVDGLGHDQDQRVESCELRSWLFEIDCAPGYEENGGECKANQGAPGLQVVLGVCIGVVLTAVAIYFAYIGSQNPKRLKRCMPEPPSLSLFITTCKPRAHH